MLKPNARRFEHNRSRLPCPPCSAGAAEAAAHRHMLRHSREMTRFCSRKVIHQLSTMIGADAGFHSKTEEFLPVGKSGKRHAP